MNSELKPKIRFKGFTDDWEQRKLEEISNRFDNLRVPVSANEREKGTIPYYGANGIQDYVKGFTHNGEYVLIAEDGANDLKNYPVKYVNGLFWANNHVHVVQGKEGICDNKYLKYCFTKTNIESLLVGGGRAKLNANIMMGIELTVPSFNEQVELGRIFYELDNLITLHQRKCDKLVELKKSLLEKMFPQNNSVIPEIRFKGFTNDWEQRKLEDFGKATGGTSIESEFSENGIYKVISIGSYSENSKYNDQGIRAILSDKTKEKILNKSDLTMILNDKTANGRIIGRVLYIDKSGTYVYNQRTERIEIYKEYFEPIFIYQLLNAPQIRNKIIKQSQGNTQIFVNWNGIKNTDYLVPNKTEQVKLGKLFTNLDNLITLHQCKYDKLNKIRQSLLNDMFI